MILITVGTCADPFERLVSAADLLAAAAEPVVVQCGVTQVRLETAASFDYVPFATFERYVASARTVVCHAGAGTVALCLRHGHRPIVVPRRPELGETIDNHQIGFARRLAELDLIALLHDVEHLPAAVASPRRAHAPTGLSGALSDELVEFISRYARHERSAVVLR